MGFECPNFSEGYCSRQSSDCTPTKGNCVLRGRFKTFHNEESEKPGLDFNNEKNEKHQIKSDGKTNNEIE
jgi:hypothetical protein